MGKVINISSESFNNVINNANVPLLVDFWATWCAPCRMMAPILDSLAESLEGKVIIGKVNVDDCEDLAIKYQINAIPNLLIFKNGELKESIVGFVRESELSSILSKYM